MSLPADTAKFIRFAFVGGVGFVVDAGMLVWLVSADVSPFAARVVSILLAMLVTWRLNRSLTFGASSDHQVREASRYLIVAASVAALNYVLYAGLISLVPACPPVLATAISTMCCMLVSFSGYGRFAFRQG